jgi:hypothetical protein
MRVISGAVVATVVAAGALIVATSGGAQAPGATALTVFEDVAHGSEQFVDNVPRSPSANPDSRRFRLSAGDAIAVRAPLLNGRRGTRIGTLYAHATVASGARFENAVLLVHGTLNLAGGQISIAGSIRDQLSNRVAVVGGTGAYRGARGHLTSTDLDGGKAARDVIELLP